MRRNTFQERTENYAIHKQICVRNALLARPNYVRVTAQEFGISKGYHSPNFQCPAPLDILAHHPNHRSTVSYYSHTMFSSMRGNFFSAQSIRLPSAFTYSHHDAFPTTDVTVFHIGRVPFLEVPDVLSSSA